MTLMGVWAPCPTNQSLPRPDLQQYSGLAVTQPLMGYLLSCHFHKQCGGQIELCISGGDHGGTPEVCLENGNSLASLI